MIRNSMKWILPSLVAVGLLIGLSALTVKAGEAKAVKGKIAGTVVDKDGKAVAEAKVNLTKPQPRVQGQQAQRPEPLATATTDKDGKFEITFEVADGAYRLSTTVQDKGTARAAVTIKEGKVVDKDDKVVEKAVELKLAARRGNRGGGAGQ
ncbi:MAG: carboxypeptidase-like regulatory domain-containing protein [Planctomycetota bacterium]|nr:carboxypeptidase-like regulatory domain-containing protein [Planctomycetota bacterium]